MQGVPGHGGEFHDPAAKSLHTLLNGRLVGPKRLIERVRENLWPSWECDPGHPSHSHSHF
jgi:hypothetical protein